MKSDQDAEKIFDANFEKLVFNFEREHNLIW